MLLLPVSSDSEVPKVAGVESVGNLGFYLGTGYNERLLCCTDKYRLYTWMNSFLSLTSFIFICGWKCLLIPLGVLSAFISGPCNIRCVKAIKCETHHSSLGSFR